MEVFKKYPSIENAYRAEWVDKLAKSPVGEKAWVITEKIHGTNTQIDYDVETDAVSLGKRNGVLSEDENFYHAQSVLKKYEPNVRSLYKLMVATGFDRLTSVIVYGELFGGSYPSEEVPIDKQASRVQKGVWYSPSNEWLCFDIGFTTEENSSIQFLNGGEWLLYAMNCNIPIVPVLDTVIGAVKASQYKNDGESLVYSIYQLPKLENNIMEGIVAKPLTSDIFIGDSRAILKSKNEHFSEVAKGPKPPKVKDDNPKVVEALNAIAPYCTKNRVINVMSHFAEPSPSDFGRILGESCKDALDDFEKDNNIFAVMEKDEIKKVKKGVTNIMSGVVREVLILGNKDE